MKVKPGSKQYIAVLACLHLILMLYSVSIVLSKFAAGYAFLSLPFCLCYGGTIILLGIYAICWQQVIRKISLTTAFSNKAVTVIWGLVWGRLFFGESITVPKIIGALLVIAGIVIYATAEDSIPEDM